MIKKLNAVLLLLVAAMLAAKLASDAQAKRSDAPVASAVSDVRNADFAPHVVFEPWLPYAIVNPMTGRNGYILDVMRAIFPKAVFVQRELTPSRTREILAADSNAVCVIYGDHPKLRDFIRAPTPIVEIELSLYYRHGLDWKYEGESSLTNISIGVTEGYLDCPVFRRLSSASTTSASHPFMVFRPSDPYYTEPLRAVLEGKVDAVGYSRVSFDAATLGVTADTLMRFAVTPTIGRSPVYMTVSNADPASAKALVEAYEKGFQEIRSTGELRRIGEYYGFGECEPPKAARGSSTSAVTSTGWSL